MTGPLRNFHSLAYGLQWASNRPLRSFEQIPDPGTQDVSVHFDPDPAPPRTVRQWGKHLWRAADGFRYLGPGGLAMDSFGGGRLVLHGVAPDEDAPLAFYGTMTALLLAARGLIPVHGSAVAWRGNAVLICGASGSGKSSLAAALLSRGAQLISDDLTLLHPRAAEMHVHPGRTTLRLFPAVANALQNLLPGQPATQTAGDKQVLQPPRAPAGESFPLRTVMLPGVETATRPSFSAQIYRPRALAGLPGNRRRHLQLTFAEQTLRLLPMDAVSIRDSSDLQRAADRAFQLLETGTYVSSACEGDSNLSMDPSCP